MSTNLICECLSKAQGSQGGRAGGRLHSDRGSHYGSRDLRRLLAENGLRQSMPARAHPYHNVWSASVIGRRKAGLLQGGRFRAETDARTELYAGIEGYDNTQRRHSSLNYLSPASFGAFLTTKNQIQIWSNNNPWNLKFMKWRTSAGNSRDFYAGFRHRMGDWQSNAAVIEEWRRMFARF